MSESSGREIHVQDADCQETIERLYHFLDGELAEDVRVKIQIHLNECPPCGDIVAFEVQLRRVVAMRCQEALPGELRERIEKALLSAQAEEPGNR